MARSTKDLIMSLLKKLDLLHTKYVHVWINNQFFENDKYEEYMDMLDEWSIDGYYDCYNWLLRCDESSKEKSRAAESANQIMAEFLSVWKRKAPDVFKEAIELMAYCAEHEFINMTPTLKERIDADWKELGTDEDKEGLYIKLLPYPMMLYRMFQDEKYEPFSVEVKLLGEISLFLSFSAEKFGKNLEKVYICSAKNLKKV